MDSDLKGFVISSEELSSQLNDQNIILLDSRWSLDAKYSSINDYKKSHIPSSIFFDLNKFFDYSSKLSHTLPTEEQFIRAVSNIGINNKNKIIIYDANGFFNSCRVWFMFKVFGHEDIVILDGGYENWVKKKLPIEKKINRLKKSHYKASLKKQFLIGKLKLEEIVNNQSDEYAIVDARSESRFLGKEPEPRKGIRKGKIKNSINIPYTKIFDSEGLISSLDILKKVFFDENNLKGKKVISTCGSGITACNILFALQILSHKKNFLYDGSWAEWGKI